MKLFVFPYLVIGALGCSKGADYYELDIDASDQSGAQRGQSYNFFFPEDGGVKFGWDSERKKP